MISRAVLRLLKLSLRYVNLETIRKVLNSGIAQLAWEGADCAVIVAHPDDETLWAGGTILLHPEARWTIVTLCRKSDKDRARKFFRALEKLGAAGAMGDLDDGPEQVRLDIRKMQDTIVQLLPPRAFELVITHGLWGEYTRHRRHEETCKAVIALRTSERLSAKRMWQFAYEDGSGQYLPRFVKDADRIIRLPEDIWAKKCHIVTDIYGFRPDSFEARTTPRVEAFWCFSQDNKHILKVSEPEEKEE
jgi:hypothetical protein